MNSSCIFVHSSEIEKYSYPESSPFKTQRAKRTKEILVSMGLFDGENRCEMAPIAADHEQLTLFHSADYLNSLRNVSNGHFSVSDLQYGIGSADCPVFPDLFAYSSLAAGGTISAAHWILQGKAHIAFNPSGGFHHALPKMAGGFCYINDIVLGCRILADAGMKVFCLDLDAHHGNGTQFAFYADPRVLTVSLHESGKTLFPWGGEVEEIGDGKGRGYNLNLPFPAGTDDAVYCKAFHEIIPPLLQSFLPDVIVLELGMDVLSVDPLTHMKMTNNFLPEVLPSILKTGKPVLATGGGGYNPESTARGWARAWQILCGIPENDDDAWLGMGGVFLGSTEWKAGLQDKQVYLWGQEKDAVVREVDQTVEFIRKTIFPMHGI